MWVRIILIFTLKFQIASLQLNGDQSVSMATRFEGSKPSTLIEDHFMKLTSFSRSIDIIWRPWQFALRTLLMYGQHPNDLNMIQLENGDVNKTLSNLEPGLSYIVAIRLYHSYADVQNITKVIATTPTFPSSTGGSNFKIETKIILKNSNKLSEEELRKFTEKKVKEELLTLEGISRVTVYTTRKSTYGYSATLYMTVEDQPTVTALFHRMQEILPSIDAELFGFSFKILKDCCSPIYVHHLNGKKASPRQQPSSEKELFNLRVIPDNAFVEGRCDQAVDMNNADITIETHGDRPIKTLTLSLFILLNQTKGLQPIMSAVNYNTQLRLEVHDGRVVWMFYSLGSSQGFIIQTKELVQVKQWTHILVDYDSQSGVGRIFVNGQLSNKEMSRVKFSENWMLGLRFGKYFSGGMDYKMSGFLDELTFFDCLMSDDAIWRLSTKCGEFSCYGENDQQIEGPKINSGNAEKKIKLKDNKTMNNLCNSAGTIQNAGSRSKECACKTNVEGHYCNKCKNGTFNLQPSNKDGCIKCFCNGLTNDCRSAQIHHVKHTISAEELPSVKLRTFEGRQVTSHKYLSYDIQEGSITYKPSKDEQSNKETLYWEIPLSFLGDKVTSYGGSLSYSLSYQINDLTKLNPGPDIVIKAGDVELHFTTDENHHLDTENKFNAMLHENFWTTKDGQPISRDQMMTSLARVDAILLRASYGNDVVRTRLQNFQMDIVSSDPVTSSSKMIASMVEECRCPPEYYGTSCQLCSRGFTKVKQIVPSKHHRCQACQCHAHASNCDGETGKCSDCKHFTTGDHCEKCLSGYYGDPRSGRSDACRPCPCPLTISTNQFSSTCHLGDDGQPICDACRQGHTGRYCQRCVAPYVGNPNKPGDYCKISQGVKCSDCDKKGSINSICDKTTGQCVCKKNVEGMKCKKCKKGTYYLHKKNKDGCLTCWCSGVSNVCTSSRYYRNSIPLDNVKGIRVTDFQEFLNIREGFYYNAMKELVLTKIQKLSDIVLYWDLPDKFTGNQLSTYGGAIKYTISYDADESGKPYSNIDIKMVGKNMILLYSNGEKINNRQVKKIKAVLREDRWTHLGGGHVTREEFLNCLSDVWNILIRATYSTKTKISSLSNFEMTGAVPFNMRKGKAFDVERCQCPTGYTGLSCEKCSRGFTKIINDLGQSKCEKCLCNGHATDCDGKTGKCIKCKHHTTGDRCDKCIEGYYGNPVKGQCKKCACPLPIQTNQFSSSCILNDDGDFTCSSCEPGYTGRKCGKCAKGYTGNPLTPGGTCKKFSQRYTAAPTVEITPQRRLDRIMTSATFKCTVHGKDPLEILWSRIDGRPLPKRALVTRTSKNSRTLVIKRLQLSDQETYICSGRNDYGLNTARAPLVVVGYQVDPIHLKITPKSMRIDQGGIARFYCKDNSETTSTIDWVSETGDLPKEATTNRGVLTIVNVQRKHSGLYTCIGSNQHSTDRVTVQLKVGVLEPPRASVSPPYGTVDIGESIEFQCSVTGYPLPTITWKRGNGKMLPRNARIDGPSLRLTDIESEDEGDYICTATNKGGIVNRRGLLYVRDSQRIPQVTVEPRSITVKPGSSVSLLCSTGDTEATYKWQKKDGRLSVRAKSQDGGRELRFNSVTLEDSGIYECLAKNNYGSDQTEAHIEVLIESGLSPIVSLEPKFATVVEGHNLTIQCNVTGKPVPIILWSKPYGWLSHNHIVTGNELKILKASPEDGGTYVCSGQNKLGTESQRSVISVERRVLPKLATDAPYKTTYVGDTTFFVCSVLEGIPRPLVFWKSARGYRVPQSYVKETDDGKVILIFKKVWTILAGSYTCVAMNTAGTTEISAELKVKGDPRILVRPRGIYRVTNGDKVQIECISYGAPTPSIILKFPSNFNQSARNEMEFTKRKGFMKFEFTADERFSGNFTCISRNRLGQKTDWVQIIVNKEDTLPQTTIKQSKMTARLGERISIPCLVTGIPNPTVHWTKEDDTESISNEPVLWFDSIFHKDGGEYHCNAENRQGKSRVSVILEVIVPPIVRVTPSNLVVRKGYSFNLKCDAIGSPKPIIEWRKLNHTEMPSSLLVSDTELVSISASTEYTGAYVCSAKNIHGEEKAYANISVVEPPWVEAVGPNVIRTNLTTNINLECKTTGDPQPALKWFKPLRSTGSMDTLTGKFIIKSLSKYDQGQYRCQASNLGGVAEKRFNIIINELPKVYIEEGLTVSVIAESEFTFNCHGQGTPMPELRWTKIAGNLSKDVVASPDGTLYFPKVTSADEGRYRCIGRNEYGSVIAEIQLSVEGAPKITYSTPSLTVNMKESAKLYCNVTGSPKPKVTWFKLHSTEMPKYFYIKDGYFMIPIVEYTDGGIFICRAQNSEGVAEAKVELKVNEFIPQFNSTKKSMIVYDRIINTLYKTSIKLSIKPQSLHGLLLYSGQLEKDFISIGLSNGFVIFQFDLGSGPAFIKSELKIRANEWITVTAQRDGPVGVLQVSGQRKTKGRSLGRFNGLNLRSELFIGGHEDFEKVFQQTKHDVGFNGCASELFINGVKKDFAFSLKNFNAKQCSTCDHQNCLNGGVCIPKSTKIGHLCQCPKSYIGQFCEERVERCFPDACHSGGRCINKPLNGYRCKCVLGKFGKFCEEGEAISVPSFKRHSYISYSVPNISPASLKISISFKTVSITGKSALLSISRPTVNTYLKLLLLDGKVVLDYDLSDGAVRLQSYEIVPPNEWSTVNIELKGRYASLSVNQKQAIKGASKGRSISLQLHTQTLVYVGGEEGLSTGLHGCVQELRINEQRIDLVNSFVEAHKFSSCYKVLSPCLSQPCVNNGKCVTVAAGKFQCACAKGYEGNTCQRKIKMCGKYFGCKNGGRCWIDRLSGNKMCRCPIGYGGESCAKIKDIKETIQFSHGSYLVYPKNTIRTVEDNLIRLSFRTESTKNGLILWYGQSARISPDFFLIGMRSGSLEVQYELGSGLAEGRTKKMFNDGQWHDIIMKRDGSMLNLRVDGRAELELKAPGSNKNLDVFSILHLGGADDVFRVSRRKYARGFVGCVRDFYVEKRKMNFHKDPLNGANINTC